MKNWMALLLACLLCWCAAGAMAEEPVTLTLIQNKSRSYDIYPNGYTLHYGGTTTFQSYEGAYVITGKNDDYDTPVEFHANAYDETTSMAKTENGQHASYDVTFNDLDCNLCSVVPPFGSAATRGRQRTAASHSSSGCPVQAK